MPLLVYMLEDGKWVQQDTAFCTDKPGLAVDLADKYKTQTILIEPYYSAGPRTAGEKAVMIDACLAANKDDLYPGHWLRGEGIKIFVVNRIDGTKATDEYAQAVDLRRNFWKDPLDSILI
jgi:hypothetical protein